MGTWQREGTIVSERDYAISTIGNHHNLQLTTDNSSLTEFTCTAVNTHGSSNKTTRVSARVGPVNFTSDPAGAEPDRYNITWDVDSGTNIILFILQYKEK